MIFDGCLGKPGAGVELMAPGRAVREASRCLTSFSPRLDRDLAELDVVDLGELHEQGPCSPQTRRGMVVNGLPPDFPVKVRAIHPDVAVLVFSAGLSQVLQWGALLGPGRAYAIGGRAYSRSARDEVRNTQRLLPPFEVPLETAAYTAVQESAGAPLWVSVSLDVLEPALVPGVLAPPGGVSLETLQAALRVIPGIRVIGFEIRDFPAGDEKANFLTALTAAELLRDNILVWWWPERQIV